MLTLLLALDCFATGDFNDLSGNHFCLLACKEEDGFGNVLRLDQLSHGDQRNNDLFKFHIDPSGLGGAGRNAVDGDAILRHFYSNTAGQRF